MRAPNPNQPAHPALIFLAGAALCLPDSPSLAGDKVPTRSVYLIGDSTVAEQKEGQPARGWGQFLQPFFKDTVLVVNRAANGRSSKSFQREGRWRDILREKPNFVLIQFGHNDVSHSDQASATLPDGEFRECLIRYIDTARKIGAQPILITPMRMRTFSSHRLSDSLGPYAKTTRAIGSEKKVPVVDLFALTTELFERLGKAQCDQFGASIGDDAHFNELGAKLLVELLVRDLRRLDTPLVNELRDGFSILAHP